ncbi:hypothetical protein [Flagellimonas lutimaris]|uniref:hypothetical protein n=1 Tax=Flagellimonas lutimaris TaxID=475082 RepID=UPI003F5CC288
MKLFTEPSGKFVIKVPTEWRYANVAAGYEEKSPFSFQPYKNPDWSFQISCYSKEEKPLNPNVEIQKFNTSELDFKEFRMDDDGFNMHIWGATVEDHTLMAKYIYDSAKESDKEILKELERVKNALSTIQLLSPDKRKLAFDLDKYEKFMASLAASFDIKNTALENESMIEFSIVVANQIDAYLRLSIVMRKQLDDSTDEMDIKYLYQSPSDRPIMERKVYSLAKERRILNDEIFNELESLYLERNKMVHRYIISEFKTNQLFEIAYRYETACEKVRLIMRDIEDEQFEEKIGIYGNGQHAHAEPTDEALKLLHAQVNDKHLLEKFERKIKST